MQHWKAAKRVLGYLKRHVDFQLRFDAGNMQTQVQPDGRIRIDTMIMYCDADFARDIDDRKSTSGYLGFLLGGLISWRSKKQTVVATSTGEAEYVALFHGAVECIWLTNLLKDIGVDLTYPPLLLEDNEAAICIARETKQHSRAKHIDIKYHFVRGHIANGQLRIAHVDTKEQLADIMTKPLPRLVFQNLRRKMGLVEAQALLSLAFNAYIKPNRLDTLITLPVYSRGGVLNQIFDLD